MFSLYMFPQIFTVISEHIRFYFLVFSVLHFLVVGSVRYIKLTRFGFRARVKITSPILSYRISRLMLCILPMFLLM